VPGELPECPALGEHVTARAIDTERLGESCNGLVAQRCQVRLLGKRFEQPCSLLGWQPVSTPECLRIQVSRFAVRARGGRRPGGGRGVSEHRGAVAGRLGVVRHPSPVGLSIFVALEHGQCPGMQHHPATGRQRLLDHQPRDLMPECDPTVGSREHARADALIEARMLAGWRHRMQRLQHPGLEVPGHDRRGVEQVACLAAQPRGARQHRVPD